jgi:predicted permease
MLFILRHALRCLARTPVVSAVVVLCVALGAGATTTVFTWIEHLVRRPLPAVYAADRLVSVVTRAQGRDESVSYPEYLDWREHATTLRGLAVFGIRQFGVRAAGEAPDASQPLWGLLVSDNYFEVLGIHPIAGRTLLPGDSGTIGQAPVAVISHRVARRFGGESAAVGREIRVNGVPFTIVGVTPAAFAGTYAGLAFDVWVPVTMQPRLTGERAALEARDLRWLQAIGRLDEGASLMEARIELAAVSRRIARAYPSEEGREAFVKPLDTGAAQRLSALFTVLLGITGLVTLIVCTNVANLLMLRGSARAGEIGIRLSLGASRAQVLSQLVAESAVLGAAGAMAGALLARWAQGLLPALMPSSPLPLALDAGWDPRAVGFALVLAFSMVLVFGIAPAVHTLRRAEMPGRAFRLKAAGTGFGTVRAALVVAQLALSMAALACAGAFLRVNGDLAAVDRGLSNPGEVLVVSTDLDQAGYHTDDARTLVAERMLSSVRALPGVKAAALATFVPLGFTGYRTVPVTVPGYVAAPDEDMTILSNQVSPEYFRTLGIAVLAGRPIDARDTPGAAAVAVVNDAFVRRFTPATSVIGMEITAGSRRAVVIGVAANGKYRFDALDKPSPALIYLPYAQEGRLASVTLHVRTEGRPGNLLPAVRQAFSALNPALPLNGPATLDDYTSLPLFPVRLGTTVLTWLGVVALLLSSAGLYGVLAYRVSQRRRELALRMALGASGFRVLRLVLRDGVRQAAAGMTLGALLAVVAMRLVAARLPRVHAADPVVLGTSAAVLVIVALIAAMLPAWRATRVEPSLALKS